MNSTISDILDREMPALVIFTHAIKYMKDDLLESLESQDFDVEKDDIIWVLTVPAILDDPAKQFMRKAAEEVQIKNIMICLVIEAIKSIAGGFFFNRNRRYI